MQTSKKYNVSFYPPDKTMSVYIAEYCAHWYNTNFFLRLQYTYKIDLIFENIQKSMIEVLNSMFERFTPSMIDFWKLQRLIFEGIKDWFVELLILHFWKMRLLYLYLKNNISKMKNEELQKWKIKNEKSGQKWKMKNSIIEMARSGCKPPATHPRDPATHPSDPPSFLSPSSGC